MSFRFLARPKWIAWTVVVVVAVVTMVYLATWQYDRLHERRADNELIEQRTAEPPAPVGELDSPETDRYRVATATGVYDPEGEVLIANQTMRASPGWWVVTPLELEDGSVLAVNRGWVPFASAEPEGSFEEFAPPEGEVVVTGLLLATQAEVEVDESNRALPRLDLRELQRRLDASVHPLWLQLDEQQPAQPGDIPVPLPPPELDDGPHLNYTGQWIIFALLTVIVYIVLVVRTAQRARARPAS